MSLTKSEKTRIKNGWMMFFDMMLISAFSVFPGIGAVFIAVAISDFTPVMAVLYGMFVSGTFGMMMTMYQMRFWIRKKYVTVE